jgi:isoquinoline 1-oxidoreductase alpha subunit
MTPLKINGKTVEVNAESDTPLLWVLRGELKLTGTKFGCGMALCGACTVHLDGEQVRACVLPLSAASGKEVTTIEGLAGREAEALRAAWTQVDVVQCGYCQSGQLMSACTLLRKIPLPRISTRPCPVIYAAAVPIRVSASRYTRLRPGWAERKDEQRMEDRQSRSIPNTA